MDRLGRLGRLVPLRLLLQLLLELGALAWGGIGGGVAGITTGTVALRLEKGRAASLAASLSFIVRIGGLWTAS